MSELLHELILNPVKFSPNAVAVSFKGNEITYADLHQQIVDFAHQLRNIGINKGERIAIYLPKQIETVVAIFAISTVGGAFVPINPLLKPEQVKYILSDCNVRVLITSVDRAKILADIIPDCHDLHSVVMVAGTTKNIVPLKRVQTLPWDLQQTSVLEANPFTIINSDMAAILYTSGSTGKPKGVVLSHLNMVTGAKSVAKYLNNQANDRILAVLPFSFDYGLSQITTAFISGACVVLMDYLFPRDVIKAVANERITGLAAVPPLWVQIAHLPWPDEAKNSLRYITNSGGAMPKATLSALRAALPNTQAFLMYGLTEAFRSTYLDPSELDTRPDSMGKAIPNAEILVVREDGTPCQPGEPGELVHRGALVAMGYWNDPDKTALRFKPRPGQDSGLPLREIAVWSGDTVKTDEQGFLYFIGRKDDMIKTSGYRVSPTEVEEVIYASGLVGQVAVLGLPHPELGQAIVAVVTAPAAESTIDNDAILLACKRHLPIYMVPANIETMTNLPKNPNGKIDRNSLYADFQNFFIE